MRSINIAGSGFNTAQNAEYVARLQRDFTGSAVRIYHDTKGPLLYHMHRFGSKVAQTTAVVISGTGSSALVRDRLIQGYGSELSRWRNCSAYYTTLYVVMSIIRELDDGDAANAYLLDGLMEVLGVASLEGLLAAIADSAKRRDVAAFATVLLTHYGKNALVTGVLDAQMRNLALLVAKCYYHVLKGADPALGSGSERAFPGLVEAAARRPQMTVIRVGNFWRTLRIDQLRELFHEALDALFAGRSGECLAFVDVEDQDAAYGVAVAGAGVTPRSPPAAV